jgi:hypothetical protein
MPLHTFTLAENIWNASFDVPVRLRAILENAIARDERWACHLFHRPGSEVWTLITLEDGEVYQWRNNELFRGTWVPDRHAMRYDEGRFSGLYNLEGRKVPSDEADDEELGGDAYKPAFGIRDAPDEPEF